MTWRQGKRWWRVVVTWKRREERSNKTRDRTTAMESLVALEQNFSATVDSVGVETPEPETEAKTTWNGTSQKSAAGGFSRTRPSRAGKCNGFETLVCVIYNIECINCVTFVVSVHVDAVLCRAFTLCRCISVVNNVSYASLECYTRESHVILRSVGNSSHSALCSKTQRCANIRVAVVVILVGCYVLES